MGDQFNLAKISDYIQSKNYNIDDRIISLLGIIEFDNSHKSRDLNYSVGRMYLKARDKRALEHLLNAADHFKGNKTLIEINMMIGVYYIREKKYEMADRYFMACYPLMPDDFEFDGENWPWIGEETSSLDLNDRIDLYTFLTPYFEHIDIKIYFVSLLFQLRCNETVQLLRTGHHKKALIHFDALFDSMPYLNMAEIERLRIEFREKRKHNFRVQIFDMATLFHYQAITHWSLSDFNIAKSIFHESMDYREDNSHYLDLSGTYSNIAMVNNNLELYDVAIKYFEKSLKLINKIGVKKDSLYTLFNLTKTYQYKFNFEKALEISLQAIEIADKAQDIKSIIISLENAGKTYLYFGYIEKSTNLYEECMKLMNLVDDPYLESNILYNLIFLYNRGNHFKKSKNLLDKLKLLINYENNRVSIEYYISLIDFACLKNIDPNYNIILKLITIIQNEPTETVIFETALLQLLKLDLNHPNLMISELLFNDINFTNKMLYLNQQFLYAYLIIKQVSNSDLFSNEMLISKIKNEIVINNHPLNKLLSEFLDAYISNNMKKMIEIVNEIIIKSLNFRYNELKTNFYIRD